MGGKPSSRGKYDRVDPDSESEGEDDTPKHRHRKERRDSADSEDRHRKKKSRTKSKLKHDPTDAHRMTEQRSILHDALEIAKKHAFTLREEGLDEVKWPLTDKVTHVITTNMDKQKVTIRTPFIYAILQEKWELSAAWHHATFLHPTEMDGEFRIADDKGVRVRTIDDASLKVLNEHYIGAYAQHMEKHSHSCLEKILGCITVTGPGRLMIGTSTHFLLTQNYKFKDIVTIHGFPDPKPPKAPKASKSAKKSKAREQKEEAKTHSHHHEAKKITSEDLDKADLKALLSDIDWLQRQGMIDYIVYVDMSPEVKEDQGVSTSRRHPRVFIRTDFRVFGLGKEIQKTTAEWFTKIIGRKVTDAEQRNLNATEYADRVRARLGLKD